MRLGTNPTRPKTRMNEAGADPRRLLEHLAAGFPGLLRGPRVEVLRQVVAQNYHWDPAGRLRWRETRAAPACRRRPPASCPLMT